MKHILILSQDHKDRLGDPRQDVLSSFWDNCPTQPIGYCYGKLAEVLFSREETENELKTYRVAKRRA